MDETRKRIEEVDTERAELDAIYKMLRTAGMYGLQEEVINAFGSYRAAGDDTQTAAAAALYDWDL